MIPNKKTKIICTIADNRCDVDFLRSLYENGMNVVRINSAHLTTEGAWKIVNNVREVSDKIAILIDTKGPEIRLTGAAKPFPVTAGDKLTIHDDTSKDCVPGHLYTSYPRLSVDVPGGTDILVDDGLLTLHVDEVVPGALNCTVVNNGMISPRKSINIPNVNIDLPALTAKDESFVNWAIDANIDFIAHSFVRCEADLKAIQDILDARGSHLKLIAKIENRQGVDNLDEILNLAYGVMVARGDLGVEIAEEQLPLIQKEIVIKCRQRNKPVIIATQMLQSMIENPRPTRAEVTDVANAIFQGADAIMLSGESASGKYPVEAVQTMTRIALANENELDIDLSLSLRKVIKPLAVVVARSTVEATTVLPVNAIVCDSYTGRIARYVATFRPKVPMYIRDCRLMFSF